MQHAAPRIWHGASATLLRLWDVFRRSGLFSCLEPRSFWFVFPPSGPLPEALWSSMFLGSSFPLLQTGFRRDGKIISARNLYFPKPYAGALIRKQTGPKLFLNTRCLSKLQVTTIFTGRSAEAVVRRHFSVIAVRVQSSRMTRSRQAARIYATRPIYSSQDVSRLLFGQHISPYQHKEQRKYKSR